MGPPARDVQEAIQRGVRAGEDFGVILPTALDTHFGKHQEQGPSSRPRLQPYISLSTQQKPLPPPVAFCRVLSKVSAAEAARLEVRSTPSGQGLWPLDYRLVRSLTIVVI